MDGIQRRRCSSSSSGSAYSNAAPEKSMQDIAYEYDDFLTECAPISENADLTCASKKNLLDDLVLKIQEKMYKHSEVNLDRLESKLQFLGEVFDFHKQSHAASNLDKLDEVALLEESKMLDLLTKAVESIVQGEDGENMGDFDLKGIMDDFSRCKKILNETISAIFKEHSKEVTFLLSELLKNHFNDDQDGRYLDLGNDQFPDNIVESLIEMGIIEYHPEDDTQVRLAID